MAKAIKAARRAGTAKRKVHGHGFKATTSKAPGAVAKAARRARSKAGKKPPGRRIIVNDPELDAALQGALLQEHLERLAAAPV